MKNVGDAIPTTFTRQCPNETCKGFLNVDWYCGLCDQYFCKDCNEPVTDDHECDPGVVETMKLLNRDSKSCPKCGMVIQKLNGCSQMWCISCHTAFDWRTGEISSGRVHNPHYIEFKRKNMISREHGDIPCGGIPSFRELQQIGAPETLLDYLIIVQNLENENIFMVDPPPIDNTRVRISYMMNYLNDYILKDFLQRQEKHREKCREISNIYEVIIHSCGDLLRQYVLDQTRYIEIVDHIQQIFNYGNEIFSSIRKRYISVSPKNIEI